MSHDDQRAGSALLDRTRELLKSDARTLAEIAESSGVGLEWLRSFSADRVRDPSVTRVEKLYTFLAGKAVGV